MKPSKKRSQSKKAESWLDPVEGATDAAFRKMQDRVFNDPNLPTSAVLLDLALMWNARRGLSKTQLLFDCEDPLVRGPVNPPWKGTRFENSLKRIKISRQNQTVFPADDRGHMQFWDYIYGMVSTIARDFKDVTSEQEKRAKEIARKYGLEEPQDPTRLLLSREAAKKQKIAAKLQKLADEVGPFAPGYAEKCLRRPSEVFASEADELTKAARGGKRHKEHLETWRLRNLMELVQHETGKWHDREIAELLKLAGLHQWTPESLRKLRSRYKSHSKLT